MADQVPPSFVLYRLGTGLYVAQALYVAAKLGIADHLASGAKTADELAAATNTHAASLRRVLRLLVSHGLFEEDEAGRFVSTKLGAAMQEGKSRAAVMLFTGPGQWASWGDLLATVKTGEPALERMFGVGPFQYFAERPEEAAIFDEAMSTFTTTIAAVVASTYDFGASTKLLDVGGGNGALMTGLLNARKELSGAVFDLPRLADAAGERIAAAGLSERCAFVGGDFFEAIPEGYDAYLLKHVIHDWNDERAQAILRNVREAMSAEAKLLIIESCYPARIDTSVSSRGATKNDCNMMVATGGRQRAEQDFRELLAASGLELVRVVPTPMVGVIEAKVG